MKHRITCDDGCNLPFIVESVETQRLDGSFDKVYFQCPHCAHEYVVYYADDEVRAMQEEMRKLHKRMMESGKLPFLVKQEKALRNRIEKRMEKLKKSQKAQGV